MSKQQEPYAFPSGFDAFWSEYYAHRSLFTLCAVITGICTLGAVSATGDAVLVLLAIATWATLLFGMIIARAVRNQTTDYHDLVGEVVQVTLMVLMSILSLLAIAICFLATAAWWTLIGLVSGVVALGIAWRFVDDLLIHPGNLPEWRARWQDDFGDFDSFADEDGFDDRI